MKLDSVIFDLDGTLWDTSSSCALAWNNIIRKHEINFRDIAPEDVAKVTGLPHADCIRTVFKGIPNEQVELLIDETISEDTLMIEKHGGDLYEGVVEGLNQLALKYPLYIVSNCQSGYIETFLAWSKLGPHFKDFECWGNTGRPKGENIKNIIDRNGLKAPIYIGDTGGDLAGAEFCQIPFIQVTYGFSDPLEGQVLAHSFKELTAQLAKPR